jgi:hypothetical protein
LTAARSFAPSGRLDNGLLADLPAST